MCDYSRGAEMEKLQYAEALVREFLAFRGFTNTLQAFEMELSSDIAKGFEGDKILDLLFSVYIPKFQADKLLALLSFFKNCFSSLSDTVLASTLSKLELSILRYYVVYAIQSARKDKVVEFLGMYGNDLLQSNPDWTPWFAIPYVKIPSLDPQFRVYFSKEWYQALRLSLRNFFNEIFHESRIPTIMKISSEKDTVNHLKKDIKQLNLKLSQLQTLLEEKEAQLCQLRSSNSSAPSILEENSQNTNNSTSAVGKDEEKVCPFGGPVKDISGGMMPKPGNESLSMASIHVEDDNVSDTAQTPHYGSVNVAEESRQLQNEGEFPEVKVDFQETFLGHTSPISRCCFSASGNNIASASVDGTVRIWAYDSSIPTSRNATIYCGAEIMSLDWECKSDRLLLIGTADGGIKAWNADAKRVVCDLHTSEAFPSVLDLKCSPVEPIFVSAAASRRNGSSYIDSLGFASLTVWNMKTWRPMTVLPLGEDPPAITSLCFNHNGKILAASATDGMIHMFDMSAGLQITGWPAHDSAISSILFGPAETSIFSLGSDGKIFEWSLQNQGHVLWSRDCSRFCDTETSKHSRHEMALDASGRRLLVTSGSVRAPIYQVRGYLNDLRSLPHTAAITTVDWHPTLPIFLTGSADHSIRVTSMS